MIDESGNSEKIRKEDFPDPDVNRKAFTERLAVALGGRSARQFAISAGISPTALNQYLKGKSEPTRPVLIAIARAAGVSVAWLAYGGEPIQTQSQSQTTPPPAEPPAPPPRPDDPTTAGSQKAAPAAFSALNDELLLACVVGVENIIQEKQLRLSPEKKAQLLIALYHAIEEKKLNEKLTGTPSDSSSTAAIIDRLVKLAS